MGTVASLPATKRIPGGAFLITDATPADCFFPEDFTEEHRQIAQTTDDFATNEVLPVSAAIEAKDFAVTRRLLREASALGLASVDIPEEYGGLEMDKVSSAIVAEQMNFYLEVVDEKLRHATDVRHGRPPARRDRVIPGTRPAGR